MKLIFSSFLPARVHLILALLFHACFAFAQNNFTYSPKTPKAGDVITFTYEPAGIIAGTTNPVEAPGFLCNNDPNTDFIQNAVDIVLTRKGKQYTGSIKTDTTTNFIFFGFSSDNHFDNNNNEGFYILLTDAKGQMKKGAYNSLALFYGFNASRVGVDVNPEKAVTYLEMEMTLYPENRNAYLLSYLFFFAKAKPKEAALQIQKEIEALLPKGLKTEEDYKTLIGLYNTAKLTEQAAFITSLRKEKFPNGKWKSEEKVNQYLNEKDPEKAIQLLEEIRRKTQTEPDWKPLQTLLSQYRGHIVYNYFLKNDWDGIKKYMTSVTDPTEQTKLFYNITVNMQNPASSLTNAGSLLQMITDFTRKEITNPIAKKPAELTPKEWEQRRKASYARAADLYAKVLYKKGNYTAGLAQARNALKADIDRTPAYITTYALLAENILPAQPYKKELETFVKNGTSTKEIEEKLKAIYTKEKGTESGFTDYLVELQKENYNKMLQELQRSLLNNAAPDFSLTDLNGHLVHLSDLKGKVVMIDFWATWCMPCVAALPEMQKIVNQYKDNPDVKFLFINTFEGVKEKQTVANFIAKYKYTFDVLLDEDTKVYDLFKVAGLPAKFIIDKNSIIRFKIDYKNEDTSRLPVMIEIAASK